MVGVLTDIQESECMQEILFCMMNVKKGNVRTPLTHLMNNWGWTHLSYAVHSCLPTICDMCNSLRLKVIRTSNFWTENVKRYSKVTINNRKSVQDLPRGNSWELSELEIIWISCCIVKTGIQISQISRPWMPRFLWFTVFRQYWQQ